MNVALTLIPFFAGFFFGLTAAMVLNMVMDQGTPVIAKVFFSLVVIAGVIIVMAVFGLKANI